MPAFAGPTPTHASASFDSPVKKRCARTPPVARPFCGYSARGVTFALAIPSCPFVTVTTSAAEPGAVTPSAITASCVPSLIPAIPPPARPCGRTLAASKVRSFASWVTNVRALSSEEHTVAAITISFGLSLITSHSVWFSGYSGFTRLITPFAVASASTSFNGTSPTSFSPFARATTSVALTPVVNTGVPEESSNTTKSMTDRRTMRPVEVTAPISPRAVVGTIEVKTSCLMRLPGSIRASRIGLPTVRPIMPEAVSSTQQGSSAISSANPRLFFAFEAPFETASIADCISSFVFKTVRRSLPYFSATSASSSDTSSRSAESEPKIRSSSAISWRNLSRSASSSIREYFVSWRRRSSRI